MNQEPTAIDNEIRELLGRAGPRPAVAEEEIAPIRAAAREEWRRLVEAERRRRGRSWRAAAALAASALLVLAAALWWFSRVGPAPAERIATVELLHGEVRIDGAGAPLASGGELAAGTALETVGGTDGAPARAALRLAGGQSLRLDAGSRVRLVSAGRLELERGALYLDSGPVPAPAVEVHTPLGTVRDIGTQFEVRLSAGEAAVRVRVREGKVALEAAGGSHLAADGEQLSLLADGSVLRAAVAPYGGEWEWVMATAPPPPGEGGSLGSFLDWYGRETGRQVHYADAGVESTVATIRLHAPPESLTPPQQAIGSVLAASGLDYRLENGSVLILAGGGS